MNTQFELKEKKNLNDQELCDLIVDSIQDIKGERIVKLDLTNLEEAPTDYFIICEGSSNVQVKAIANNIQKRVKEETGTHPFSSEGVAAGKWICIDYLNVVVHVFYNETRAVYELEALWSDAKFTEYQTL